MASSIKSVHFMDSVSPLGLAYYEQPNFLGSLRQKRHFLSFVFSLYAGETAPLCVVKARQQDGMFSVNIKGKFHPNTLL